MAELSPRLGLSRTSSRRRFADWMGVETVCDASTSGNGFEERFWGARSSSHGRSKEGGGQGGRKEEDEAETWGLDCRLSIKGDIAGFGDLMTC